MEDKYLIAKEKLEKYGQEHLLEFYAQLDKNKQQKLLEDILNTDFDQIQRLYNNIQNDNKNLEAQIEPIEYVNKEKLSKEEKRYYENIGQDIIKNGQYAVVTMAGGQRHKTWS